MGYVHSYIVIIHVDKCRFSGQSEGNVAESFVGDVDGVLQECSYGRGGG